MKKRNKTSKNIILTLITTLALICITVFSIISAWYNNQFQYSYWMLIIWGISLVWIIVFIYANCIHKSKRRKKNNLYYL